MNNSSPQAGQSRLPAAANVSSAAKQSYDAGHHIAASLFVLAVCVASLFVAQHLSQRFDYHSVIRTLRNLPARLVTASVLVTVISYLAMVGRDAAGLRALGVAIPRSLLWIGATAGSALGNAIGFGVLTGGAARVRVFGAGGVSTPQVARLTAVTSVTFVFGLIAFSGLGLVVSARSIGLVLKSGATPLCSGGIVILAACGLILAGWRPQRFPGLVQRLGLAISRREIVAQLALVGIDVVGAGATLYLLLPATQVGFVDFLSVYVVALLLGVIGHTPGGLGVFEAVIIFTIGREAPPAAVVAALLAYRGIYFLLPLLLAGALLAAFEISAVARRLAPPELVANSQRVKSLAPLFLGAITFAYGAILLVSGATPAFGKRLALLQMALPLWVVEGSQLVGSVLGVMLLFVARGLLRRLDGAWWFAIVIAAVSLVLSLAKGLAFVEAGTLGFLVLLLAATRHCFDRPASLFQQRFSLGWCVAIGIVLTVAFWVLFFAFRGVPYSRDLWWQFEFDARASRALRATVGAALFAFCLAMWQLLRLGAGRRTSPTSDDLHEAAQIVRGQERSDAVLAMMGDKSLLFSRTRRAFLMYGKRGRSWVALHDPVGPPQEWPELIAEFVALAHRNGGRASFYQVRPDALPLYLEAGLTLIKLGEEACISLSDFQLEGPQRTRLRYALKRGERDGLAAEVVDVAADPTLLPILRQISDAWLAKRRAREKSFSVAAFDASYLQAQSVILVRQHGRPVAFASFMTTDLHTEATVGVMRHVADASPYTMEFLFTRLSLHLKQAGFRRLSLGMAPLAGLRPAPLAGTWYWVGHLLWRFGGRLYNFRGLRSFKSKFDPDWQPRYLAASGLLGPFLSLVDLAALAGNGS